MYVNVTIDFIIYNIYIIKSMMLLTKCHTFWGNKKYNEITI